MYKAFCRAWRRFPLLWRLLLICEAEFVEWKSPFSGCTFKPFITFYLSDDNLYCCAVGMFFLPAFGSKKADKNICINAQPYFYEQRQTNARSAELSQPAGSKA
jgi:hypothetical protein